MSLSYFRVAAPLSRVSTYVAAATPEVAIRAVLTKFGYGDRDLEFQREGPGWYFYKVSPPLPHNWCRDTTGKTIVNRGDEVSVLEAERQGPILVAEVENGND